MFTWLRNRAKLTSDYVAAICTYIYYVCTCVFIMLFNLRFVQRREEIEHDTCNKKYTDAVQLDIQPCETK